MQIKYVTISSRYIKGATLRGEGSVPQKIAGAGYKQVRAYCTTAQPRQRWCRDRVTRQMPCSVFDV